MFKERLNDLITESGYKREIVAVILGVTLKDLDSNAPISVIVLIRAASFFQCTTDYILGLSNSKNEFEVYKKIDNEVKGVKK